jgi:general secretion pathway protein D
LDRTTITGIMAVVLAVGLMAHTHAASAPAGQGQPSSPSAPPAAPVPAPPRAEPPGSGQASARPGAASEKTSNDAARQIQIDRDGLITMHTNELDVRQLLELISRRSGLSILVSPKVSGNITANFERVTQEQLLASVLKLANLVEKKDGPVRYIYTKEELDAERESKKKERILTKVYKLNYIRADELMTMIRPFLSEDVGQKRIQSTANYTFGISEAPTFGSLGGTTSGGGMMAGGVGGAGGGVMAQRGIQPLTGGTSLAGSDVLVVQDYESNLKIIDQIVQRVDVQPVQVLIEAVIISVELDRDKELGVNFGVVDNLGQTLGVVGSGAVLNSNVGFTPASVLTAAGKIIAGTPPDPTGFASADNGVKFGFVSNNTTGFIRALETVGSTKILASPRILVLNKQRAEIQLGARLGFRGVTSQNFTSTVQAVQFLNTGTLLRLRPFVSSDGMVRMEIHPERSQGTINADGLPNATTAELTTNVMVPDGATLVIGGLMEDEDDYQQQGLPGVSRVPALGYLFGFKQKQDFRRELVVLLTPHIWPRSQPNAPHATDMAGQPARGAESSKALAPAPSPGMDMTARTAFVVKSEKRSGQASTTASPDPAFVAPKPGLWERMKSKPRELRARLGLGNGPSTTVGNPKDFTLPADPPAKPTASAPVIKRDPDMLLAAYTGTQQSPPIPGTTAAVSARKHLVATGETFGTIARDYYGSDSYAKRLWWANRGKVAWPQALAAGTTITVPRIDQLETLLPIAPAVPAQNLAQPGPVETEPAPAPYPLPVPSAGRASQTPQSSALTQAGGYSVHVVRRHETLRSIARDRLGDLHRSDELADLNRDVLGPAGQLTVGQRLILPADASAPRPRP